jgi:two-component system, NtrC family, response regulator HydG
MLKILVADDDQGLRFSVREQLASTGLYEIEEACDGLQAVEKARAQRFDLVILDVDMPNLTGLEAMTLIKENDPSVVVLILTAYANLDDAVRAVKEGAYNYVAKPVKSEDLLQLVEKALAAQVLIANVAASAPVLMESGRKIIGSTNEMKKVFNIINRLAKVDTPVLIRGASGTGKELVARAIHFNSSRKDAKFVAINCSAIPENLFESELFGHEKGSFTGAHERKIGKFQFAEGGTLFLDELGDMPVLMQVKLLRVLQEKVFVPVGGNREIESNVRVIAATNRPLEQMISDGKFREDLFYRLNVVPIFLPALCDRKNDLEVLIHNFIKKFNREHAKRVVGITPDAMAVVKKYTWPGNIRELENVIEHSFILENTNLITLSSLPENILISTGIDISKLDDLAEAEKSALIRGANASGSNGLVAALSLNPATGGSAAEISNGHVRSNPLPKNSLSAGSGTATGSGSGFDLEDLDFGSDVESDLDMDDTAESDDIAGLQSAPVGSASGLDFNRQKEEFEKDFIIKALKTFKGRINQTALHANIPKKTLLRKIEKYGINAKEYIIAKV